MLKSLSISNIAVIKNAVIDFGDGLNILTGETGAGKSIIIDSINLILGNRASKDIVRTGETKAKVEALFDVDKSIYPVLEEYGIGVEDGQLLISRQISTDGNNNIRINGNLSTLLMLKDIGKELINIHGQNDNQDLLNSDKHIGILDKYAKNSELLSLYKKEYKEAQSINSKINELTMDTYEKERRLSLLTYEIEAIENVNLVKGEYEELIDKRNKFLNGKKISDNLLESYNYIKNGYNGMSSLEMLASSMKNLGEISEFDKDINEIYNLVSDIYYNLEDAGDKLRDYMSSFVINEREIEEIEKRLDEINDLRRRFGADYEAITAYYNKISKEVEEINLSDEKLNILKSELENKKAELNKLSTELTKSRIKAAAKLKNDVMMHLKELNMPDCRFEVEIVNEQKFGKNGVDKVEFLISANPGMEMGKLSKIASGGELSRIMLAINCALLDVNL